MNTEIYITVTGTAYRHGHEFVEPGMIFRLVKEPENEYDKEAIKVEMKPIGKIGYVANSPRTVVGECYSAGRLYDKIGDFAEAEVMLKLDEAVICKVLERQSK